MKCIVHIGLPKTGSTSIQHWLRLNREALLGQGVSCERVTLSGHRDRISQLELAICQHANADNLFPDAFIRQEYGLSDLASQAEFAKQYSQAMNKWVRNCDAHTCVMSSEHIGSATKSVKLAEGLDRWLAQWFDERTYVVYIRRQEDWLLSSYSQALRFGYTRSLSEFVKERAPQDYAKVARIWTKAVGASSLRLRLLEHDCLKNGDLLADFAKEIGVPTEGLSRPERQNEAMGVHTAELLRLMNTVRKRLLPNRVGPVPWRVGKHLFRLSRQDEKLALAQEDVDRIRARQQQANELLCKSYFPDRMELFPPKPPTNVTIVRARRAELLRVASKVAGGVLQEIFASLFRRSRIEATS